MPAHTPAWKLKLARSLRAFNITLIVISVILAPTTLLIIGYVLGGRKTMQEAWWQLLLVLFGVLVIATRVPLFFLTREGGEEFRDLVSEGRFLVYHATSAWSIGGGLACILTAGYFLFPVNGNLFERYASGLGMYLSILAVVLGVHAFYRRTAPILNMNQLLDKLTEDMENLIEGLESGSRHERRLWMVYPAMNLGHYRSHESPPTYERFKTTLLRCSGILKENAKAITYKETLYKSLYESYERGLVHRDEQNGAELSNLDAIDFVKSFRGTKEIPRGRHLGLAPNELPQHVIIIGNITYLLMSYGLPIYEVVNGQETFRSSLGEKQLARVLAYRREDPGLAEFISGQLAALFQEKQAQQRQPQ